ncbi:DUF1120 domain-containing protein [Pseudomonas vranovensis]|uniref:DUF1120 domain-containing protein n=1 Tax=Pseudomonas vranovensis TaxID=321661 RepID=A0A423CU36_9PSED|nr:DUF1120 domain-containing protein [Pseudomonas vranovensis]ROL62770.1 hypothetical protein BHU25_24165 [Pseudomonas vranovensis]
MKKSVLSLAVLMSLASANAMAATTDLTVTGNITPAACTPTFANAGVVDYGSLAVTELEEISYGYLLPKKSLNLSIECNTPAAFALIASDNRRDSGQAAGAGFGLGKHQDQDIGAYRISWSSENVLIDGVQGTTVESMDAGNSWQIVAKGMFEESGYWPSFRVGFSSGVEPRPTAASSVNVIMDILGHVKKDLPFSDRVELDGSTTVELLYL